LLLFIRKLSNFPNDFESGHVWTISSGESVGN
jgi:hypothetical protein